MTRYYDDVDVDDDEIPVLVRFMASLEAADSWLATAIRVLDEEGEPHPAAAASLEAAHAAIVATARAELLDPWWQGRSDMPRLDEISFGFTPAELVEDLWRREEERKRVMTGEED